MFESYLVKDAEMVFSLQQYFHQSTIEGMATSCSKLGDPRYTYAVIFPIIFWLVGPRQGGVVLVASSLAEWTNIALKWISRGDRPYWWVGEHPDLWNSSNLLIQVPITCETGPGMPSGHVMISLSTLLCCCRYVGGGASDKKKREDVKGKKGVVIEKVGGGVWWRRVSLCLVVVFSAIIGLTRVLISTHFIHQVVFGMVVGVFLFQAISNSRTIHHRLLWTTPTSSTPLLIFSLLILTSGLFLYWILNLLNLDPAFSVPLAQQHCQDSSWVHLDTTPLYSLVRSAGALWGMSLVARSGVVSKPVPPSRSLVVKFGCLVISLAVIRVIGGVELGVGLLGSKVLGFYAEALVKSALVPVATAMPFNVLQTRGI